MALPAADAVLRLVPVAPPLAPPLSQTAVPSSSPSVSSAGASESADRPREPSIVDLVSQLENEIADHLLDAIHLHLKNNPTESLLIEATFQWSSLFNRSGSSEDVPAALALFSYPADTFAGEESAAPTLQDAISVIEVATYEPYDQVYASLKESIAAEGFLDAADGTGARVIFAISDGKNSASCHRICAQLATENSLVHLTFGGLSRPATATPSENDERTRPDSNRDDEDTAASGYASGSGITSVGPVAISSSLDDLLVLTDKLTATVASADQTSAAAANIVAARMHELEVLAEDTLSDVSQTTRDIAADMGRLRDERDMLATRLASTEAQLLEKTATSDGLEAVLKEKSTEFNNLQAAISDKNDAFESLKRDLVTAQNELTIAREGVSQCREEKELLQAALTEKGVEADGLREKLANDLAASEVAKHDFQSEIDRLNLAVSKLTDENSQLSGQLSSVTAQLDAANLKAVAELAAVVKENDTLSALLKERDGHIESTISVHEETMGNLREELEAALLKLKFSDEKSAALLQEKVNLSARISELVSEIAEEKQRRASESDLLMNEKTVLTAKASVFESQLAELQAKYDILNATNRSLFTNYKQLSAAKETKEAELTSANENLKAQLTKLQAEFEVVSAQKSDALLDLAEADEELRTADARIADLGQVIQTMKFHMSSLVEQTSKSRVVTLEEHIGKLEKTISSLRAETQFLKSLLAKR
ncbi:hypothetical protein HDU84_009778 [Entophlyctis sp. JEL0112]|nr:hypothetical protein HDU84_009778 [Entophlyctis sp. JEL0112]